MSRVKLNRAIGKAVAGLTPPLVSTSTHAAKTEFRRFVARRRLAGSSKLHLACGRNVLLDWANVDLDGTDQVTGWDLTKPLPVRSESIQFIFCEHFIEHITMEEAAGLLRECHRALRPGGVLRLSTPNLRRLVDEYLAGRVTEWIDVGWEPATPCRLVNEGLRLWGHQFVYDQVELPALIRATGFQQVVAAAWHESTHPELRNLECRPYHGEVILEATR